MFRKKKIEEGPAPQLVKRWKAIAARAAPLVYTDAGGREQRASRQAVYRQAIAILEGGETLPVVIRNLSSAGCRIEFFRQTPLTPQLILDEHSLSLHYEAEVVWQGGGAAGLRFVGAGNESSDEDRSSDR
jgi:hypothetical protein